MPSADIYDAERSLWMKWRLPGLVALGILVVCSILFIARGSLLPIIISVIVAELLFPIVSTVERVLPGRERYPQIARVVTIALVYIAFFALVAALIYLTVQPIIKEVQEFIQVAPQIYEQAKVTIEGWIQQFDQRVPEGVKAQLDDLLQSASGVIGKAALALLTKTITGVTGTISVVIGLVIVPFLLFYMLKDKEELVTGMHSVLPENVSRHTHNVLALIDGVVGSYVRAQLISATIVGVLVFIGLFLLDVNFALTLGPAGRCPRPDPHHRSVHRSRAGTAGRAGDRPWQAAVGRSPVPDSAVCRKQYHLTEDSGKGSQATSHSHYDHPDNCERTSRAMGSTCRCPLVGGCAGRLRVLLL